jgi:hypothetical protein
MKMPKSSQENVNERKPHRALVEIGPPDFGHGSSFIAPRPGATRKQNLRQLDFAVFVPPVILG